MNEDAYWLNDWALFCAIKEALHNDTALRRQLQPAFLQVAFKRR